MSAFRTTLLLSAMTALLGGFGWMLDRSIGTHGSMTVLFLGIGIAMNWVSYFYSDKIVLRMYGAREVSREEAPVLHDIVDRVAANAGIPKPRVCIVPEEAPNAFATGRNPEHGVVACTEGIMRLLNREELAGVIAHEIGHIKNRDTLVSTVAASIAGAISGLATLAYWVLALGGGHGDDEEGGSPLGAIGGLLMIMLAPFAAVFIQMAISRTREYGADAAGARFSGDPRALASALQKIETYGQAAEMPANPSTAHMFIINPLSGGGLQGLFLTHPPTAERVRRLLGMTRG